MSLLISSAARPARSLRWRAVAMSAILIPMIVALELLVPPAGRQAPDAATAVDPRLVIHARSMPIVATVSGGAQLEGSLYPALPGRNTLRLALTSGVAEGRIAVAATMPGMRMVPIRGTLTARGGVFSGTLVLPMFGHYTARLAVHAPTGVRSGVVALALPLPGEQ